MDWGFIIFCYIALSLIFVVEISLQYFMHYLLHMF